MTSEAGRRPAPVAPTLSGPSLTSKVYGFGSIFGKTLRDSRRAVLVVAILMGATLIGVSNAIVREFATPQARQGLVDIVAAVPPILQGLAGKPVNVDILGGYLQYKYGTFFPLIAAFWSILALSATLAAEARRGSLEFVAATRWTRRRIALEKLFAHVSGLAITGIVIFLSLVVIGATVRGLPGDEISVESAAGYALWLRFAT